jgi:hypothetical protein
VEWKIEMLRGAGAQIEAKLQVLKLLMIDRKTLKERYWGRRETSKQRGHFERTRYFWEWEFPKKERERERGSKREGEGRERDSEREEK